MLTSTQKEIMKRNITNSGFSYKKRKKPKTKSLQLPSALTPPPNKTKLC